MTNLYSVTYNTNNSTGGTTPATQTAESDATTYTFTAPTAEQHGLVKTGYTFMGWADSPTAPVQQYDPGSTISLSSADSAKTLYAVWGLKYTIDFNLDNGTGTAPAKQEITIASDPYEFTIPNIDQSNIVKPGFAANGWATSSGASTSVQSVTVSKANPNATVYPVWKSVDWNSMTKMQQMTSSICTNAGNEKSLADVRDNTSYNVKKLSDGKCWMTQNLRIVNKAITSADSDVTSNYTIPASSAPWSNTQATTNKVHYANNTTYGAYYSWYAATAGTSASVSTDGQNASSSICPKGWKLPTSKAGGEFEALVNKGRSSWTTNSGVSGYWLGGTTANATGAAFFPAGGYVISGSLNNAGSEGRYWSSTAQSASNAYYLYFNSSTVNPSNIINRYYGFSVRCVAR